MISSSNARVNSGVFVESEEEIRLAYVAVLDAEQVGANVSLLLDKLNIAGDYLSTAYFWYNSGDSVTANNFANMAHESVLNVANEAVDLMDAAKATADTDFSSLLFTSVIGVVAVIIICSVAWIAIKRRYLGQVMDFNVEATSQ
jgi:hypothetical protein